VFAAATVIFTIVDASSRARVLFATYVAPVSGKNAGPVDPVGPDGPVGPVGPVAPVGPRTLPTFSHAEDSSRHTYRTASTPTR
jgi:hypothetical protein